MNRIARAFFAVPPIVPRVLDSGRAQWAAAITGGVWLVVLVVMQIAS